MADRRRFDRAEGEQVTMLIERGEEGDAQAALSHGVDDPMRGDCGGERYPSNRASHAQPSRWKHHRCSHTESGSEEQRMRDPTVPEETLVRNAERERYDIDIRHH